MATNSDPNLPPEARRGTRSRIVWLVAVIAFVSTLAPCLLWTVATQQSLRRHFDEAGPAVLGWSADRMRARLDAAQSEIERIGGKNGAAGWIEKATLESALDSRSLFSALLVLDQAGELRAVAGDGPVLESLLRMLDAKSALGSELVAVMQGAQLRKQLGSVNQPTLHVLDAHDKPPLPVAGVPLLASNGKRVGTLQGLLKRDEMTAALLSEVLGVPSRTYVTNAEGQVVAWNGPDALPPSAEDSDTDLLQGMLGHVSRGWRLRYEAPLDAFEWTLVVEAPVLAAFQPLALPLALTLVLPPAMALCFGLIALWRATRLTRPLWALYASMRGVARDEGLDEVEARSANAEVESLIGAFNATVRRLQREREHAERDQNALRAQNRAFQAQQESLSKLTITDSLTQLANRRQFENQLNLEIKRLSRNRGGLSMLVVDVDDFKKLNDTLGHAAGDEFLKQIASILSETVRETDLVARYGGEEFVVVATNTALEGAVVLGQKVCTAVAEASFIVDSSMRPQRATISVGVAEFRGSQTDLFNSADAALYEAKSAGKNCVMAAGSSEDAV
jgi:diguanylate cyclase (GGDEF)-like protein